MRLNQSHLARYIIFAGLLGWFGMCAALAEPDEEDEVRTWQEVTVQLPPAPLQENLVSFYVSAATDNHFYIDGTTLMVGADGVVRYVLVVRAPGGASNVSFEGMRCATRERRLYASGRPDGSWVKPRNSDWRRILDVPANRQHAALFLDYFCPAGVIVGDADEARSALRRGGHSNSRRY